MSGQPLNLRELSESFKFSEETLRELLPVYGSELERVVRALKSPGKRYYVRVSTLRTTPEKVRTRLAERIRRFTARIDP